jgi:Tol biopolymer transport system component
MIGKTLGHYEILKQIGAGGMGEVYRARDTRLDRAVAIKILPSHVAQDSEMLERFQREARSVAALSHPHILAIHDFGEAGGTTYAVMELLNGKSVRECLAEGPFPPRKAIEYGQQIASGLAAAHDKSIVHRDLKPENLFLCEDGRMKILDFGLARTVTNLPGDEETRAATVASVTEPGTVLGTAGYMSPEQVRGEAVDHRSDIFSVGAVLWEMVKGRRAFRGDSSVETMHAILTNDPEDSPDETPSTLPVLDRIIRRCLEKNPAERFQSAHDLAFALETSSGISAATTPIPTRAVAGGSRQFRVATVVAALGWALAMFLFFVHNAREAVAPEPARFSTLTYSGRDWSPAVSSRGDMVAFVSDRDGRDRIWLKQLSGGGEEPLTAGRDASPRFSPDGSQILFVRDEGVRGTLYRTPVVGGQPRKVLEDVVGADWSPDGEEVTFVRIGSKDGRLCSMMGIAKIQSSEERIIAEFDEWAVYGVRWSPDGYRIAACQTWVGNTAENHLILVDPSTGTVERLFPSSTPGPYAGVAWAPHGNSLIISQAASVLGEFSGPIGQLMQFDLHSKGSRTLFWSTGIGTGPSSFSPAGTDRVVFVEESQRQPLLEMSLSNSTEIVSLTQGIARDRQPAYSPDDRWIVFSSNRSGNLDVWTLDRTTGDLRQLTDDLADDWDPAFMPDGSHIVWSTNRSGNLEVWMATADGSHARQITRDGVDAENPTVTQDGQWIVYISFNPDQPGVWKIRPDGTEATRIAEGTCNISQVSPDGRFAVYLGLEGLGKCLRVVDVESGEHVPFEIEIPRRLFAEDFKRGRPRWTPDGRAIAFVGEDDDGRTGIYTQQFVPGEDTSETRRRLAGFSEDYVSESFDISHDGSTIALCGIFRTRSLKLAENVALSE